MFPIPWNKAFRKKDGTLVNMEDMGGGGGSFTPDYENEIVIVGTQGDFEYYIPMSKRYLGESIEGYEIKTNPETSAQSAMIDIYSIEYAEGSIVTRTLIKTLVHNGDNRYTDDYISISYVGSSAKWSVAVVQTLYNTSGVAYGSHVEWGYATVVDYTMLKEDPTQEES